MNRGKKGEGRVTNGEILHVHADILLFFPDYFITSAPLQLRADKVKVDRKRRKNGSAPEKSGYGGE